MTVRYENLIFEEPTRIIWFGALSKQLILDGIPQIYCFLAPIVGDPRGWGVRREVIPAMLDIGQLTTLFIGAHIEGGIVRNEPSVPIAPEVKIAFDLDPAKCKLVGRDVCDAQGILVMPQSEVSELLREHEGYSALFQAIPGQTDPFKVLIPAAEIFRVFYCPSSRIAEVAVTNQFLDPNRYLWDVARSQINAQGEAHIRLRRRMLDTDARFLAQFAFSPSALKSAMTFAHGIASQPRYPLKSLRPEPPFPGPIKVEAMALPIASGARHLVTRIIGLSYPVSFRTLEVSRDNDSVIEPGRQKSVSGPAWQHRRKVSTNEPDNRVDVMLNPPNYMGGILNVPESRVSSLHKPLAAVQVSKVHTASNLHDKSGKRRPDVSAALSKGSFSRASSSQELLASLLIMGKELESKIRASAPRPEVDSGDVVKRFARFHALLSLISQIAGVGVRMISGSMPVQVGENVYAVLPEDPDRPKNKWVYVDDARTMRRVVAIAEITFNGKARYLFELQLKEKEAHSTMAVWEDSGAALDSQDVDEVLKSIATTRGPNLVGSAADYLMWRRLVHRASAEINADYAAAYLARVFEVKSIKR